MWLAAAICVEAYGINPTEGAGPAMARAREGLAQWQALGTRASLPLILCELANILMGGGRPDEAEELNAAARGLEGILDRTYTSEIHRQQGELVRMREGPDAPEAEVCFERALAVAREQGARMLELRVTTSLARLRRDQGRAAEGRALLAPLYESFTEGFDTRDLQDAQALLEELA